MAFLSQLEAVEMLLARIATLSAYDFVAAIVDVLLESLLGYGVSCFPLRKNRTSSRNEILTGLQRVWQSVS